MNIVCFTIIYKLCALILYIITNYNKLTECTCASLHFFLHNPNRKKKVQILYLFSIQVFNNVAFQFPVQPVVRVSFLKLDFKKPGTTHYLSFSILTHPGWHGREYDTLDKAKSTLWPKLKIRQGRVQPIAEKSPRQISTSHIPVSLSVSWAVWHITITICCCMLSGSLMYDIWVKDNLTAGHILLFLCMVRNLN